ncbi:hemolymph lipopolysaccharide-binding protein-like isoform X2 [Periplaneta americana]
MCSCRPKIVQIMLLGFLVVWCAGISNGLRCISPQSSAFKFSVNSRRNSSGHWIAEVKLGHDAEQSVLGPLEVDVDHTIEKCTDSESVQIVARVTAPPQRPGPGYELVPGLGFYKFHTDFKDFNDAVKACAEEGTHLAIINSDEESDALKPFWDPHPQLYTDWKNNCAYVGFHDKDIEGQYVTIFNNSLNSTGFVKWHPGEPSLGAPEDCGIVFRGSGLLGDVTCTYKLAFFCEKEL